jgi:hypothetical protein
VHLRIFRQVAQRNELPVAGEVGEGDRGLVEHMEEAGRAAAMLNRRLAVSAGGGEEDAGLGGEKCGEVIVDLGRPSGVRLGS